MGSVTEMSGASIGTDLDGGHPKLRSEGSDIITGKSDETVRLFALTMGKWARASSSEQDVSEDGGDSSVCCILSTVPGHSQREL